MSQLSPVVYLLFIHPIPLSDTNLQLFTPPSQAGRALHADIDKQPNCAHNSLNLLLVTERNSTPA